MKKQGGGVGKGVQLVMAGMKKLFRGGDTGEKIELQNES